MPEIQHSTTDVPDERDYQYGEIVGWDVPPVTFPTEKITWFNQLAQPETYMACSRYGITHVVNGQNLLVNGTQPVNPVSLWEEYIKINPSAISDGATLQSALKQVKDEWLIAWYAKVSSIDQIKQAIDRGHFIYTWSKDGNWQEMERTHVYSKRTDWRIVGHCWCIVGYDQDNLYGGNSCGQSNGLFKFPNEYYQSLFSQYAILPTTEINALQLYKQKIMDGISIDAAKTAFLNGFFNWERPNEPATREEVAAMVERAFEAIKAGK